MNNLKMFWLTVKSLGLGMGVTLRTMLKPAITLQYPDERPQKPKVFRGFLHNDVPRCVACDMCANICPVDCFKIVYTRDEKGRRQLHRFDIDMVKCMFCGLCTEVCPTECLTMTGGFEHATWDRKELVLHFVTPDKPALPVDPALVAAHRAAAAKG
ncbi:MAG: NADH-quinone oxidoreductase subunit I [Elusimicrobia bacterium]|nr:NADH-quinone oxidoreductase subunit I [Elusimicrobiota bacterium]